MRMWRHVRERRERRCIKGGKGRNENIISGSAPGLGHKWVFAGGGFWYNSHTYDLIRHATAEYPVYALTLAEGSANGGKYISS